MWTFWQFDGVDATFTPFQMPAVDPTSTEEPVKSETKETSDPDNTAEQGKKGNTETPQVFYPVKKDEFAQLGQKSQLQVAIALTNHEPDPHDFDNFPHPSQKEIEAVKAKAEAEAKAEEKAEESADPTKLKWKAIKKLRIVGS